MIRHLAIAMLFCVGSVLASITNNPVADVLVVVGAPGEETFEEEFNAAAAAWATAARQGNKVAAILEARESTNQLDSFQAFLERQPTESNSELWIILIGHGTFDGKEAKFNMRGPDLASMDLARLLKPFKRTIILVNSTSSSGPFLKDLSAPGRIIITATKSGWEENFTRFGRFIATAIADPAADLDKDGQTSLLEAFLMASRQVDQFYASEQRLATEHALLDDNGDAFGIPATFFQGVRATKSPQENAGVDGLRAHQVHLVQNEQDSKLDPAILKQRNQLELELEQLRSRKDQLSEDAYLKLLEEHLLKISRLYFPASKPSE